MNKVFNASNRVNRSKRLKPYPVNEGVLHFNCKTKNIAISVTDRQGKVLDFMSTGMISGLKNAKKKTPNASEETIKRIFKQAYDRGMRRFHLRIIGFYFCRNSIKCLSNVNLPDISFLTLEDKTQIQHGGCKPRKMKKKKRKK